MKRVFNPKILVIALLFFALAAISARPALAQPPNLFFSTPPAGAEVGDRLTIDVKVQSVSQSINAVTGSILFSPDLLHVVSISQDAGIINFWTGQPTVERNKISFEGIILNPGFQSSSGLIFHITFEAIKSGTATLSFGDGAVLANDGRGSNILTSLGSTSFKIAPGQFLADNTAAPGQPQKLAALPVITDYTASVLSNANIYVKGKGEPDALTKIVFQNVAVKSLGEKLIAFLQTKKKTLDDVLVRNDDSGGFEYVSAKNVVAGVYNATPFLVDNDNTEKPGLGVQLLVSDSKIVKALVVLINVLGLLIPIVGLIVIIYFIPWYSYRRMRLIKKRLGLEEEKIEITGHQLERQDKMLDKNTGNSPGPGTS